MTTAIESPAKREHVEEHSDVAALTQAAIAQAQATASTVAKHVANPAMAAAAQRQIAGQFPGLEAQDFVRDNRIQIKNGSLFVDPYLVIHPRELAPANEAKLRDKLRLTYTVNNPSFYESYDRFMIAMNLGQLVPVSMAAQRSKLMEEVKRFNATVDQNGPDAALAKKVQDKLNPFAAIVRDTIEKPQSDPVGVETLKNGLAIYLMLREKLTSLGYLNKLSDYVGRAQTPDQVLGEFADKVGVSPLMVREAALRGGIDGVGQVLKLDPAYVADVKRMVDYASTQDFGFNVIEHWHLGRQLLGIQAPMAQKIAHGLEARISSSVENFRRQVRHHFEVPEPVKAEEKRIADSLNLLEPIQRVLMHKLGYEICFTPEFLADDIAMYKGIYGLHRKAASDLRDTRGTYRIYFSGRGDLKGSMRTMVHEVAHNLWPEQFTAQEVQHIDALAKSDEHRFLALKRLMDERFTEFSQFLTRYQKAGSDAERAAIVQTTKAQFAAYGVSIDEGVLPYLRDANELRYLVSYCVDTLREEGERYAKSGYDSPGERFREVISRFAELKQVELSGSPQLMQFLAPGLNQVWENHYIPHLNRVHSQLQASEKAASDAIARAEPTSNMPAAAPAPEEPKVEERPVAPTPAPKPVQKSDVDACVADAVVPSSEVHAPSIDLGPPLQALAAMNIHPMQ